MVKNLLLATFIVGFSLNVFAEEEITLKSDVKSSVEVQSAKKSTVTSQKPVAKSDSSEKTVEQPEIQSDEEKSQVKEGKAEKQNVELAEQIKADNDYIREVFNVFSEALKTNNVKKLKDVTTEHFIVIGDTQELLNDKKTVEEYFPKNIGFEHKYERVELSLEPGFSLNISKEGTWGIIYGKGSEKLKLNDAEYDVPVRVTAVVVKEGEGWKINSVHLGVNFLDNPILVGYEELGMKFLLIGFVLGVVITLILGMMVVKSKK